MKEVGHPGKKQSPNERCVWGGPNRADGDNTKLTWLTWGDVGGRRETREQRWVSIPGRGAVHDQGVRAASSSREPAKL